MDLYLGSPLALKARSGLDCGVVSVKQGAQAVNLLLRVDVDAEISAVVAGFGQWSDGGGIGEGRGGGQEAVKEAGEEEGRGDKEEGGRLVGPCAGRGVVVRAPHGRQELIRWREGINRHTSRQQRRCSSSPSGSFPCAAAPVRRAVTRARPYRATAVPPARNPRR